MQAEPLRNERIGAEARAARPERVLVIVPALNEEESIPRVVRDLRTHAGFADIIVVDDGSTDRTAWVARLAGAHVVRLPFNLGIGAAMQTGFKYAMGEGYDAVVQFDGDGQHDARAIARLLDGLSEADVVIGSRYLAGGPPDEAGPDGIAYVTPPARRLGMVIFALVVSLITGQRLTDTTSGFRALGRSAMRLCAGYYPSDYPEVEALTVMHRAGLRLAEVPVPMRPRQAGDSSITWPKAVYYMVKVALAMTMGLLRRTPAGWEE